MSLSSKGDGGFLEIPRPLWMINGKKEAFIPEMWINTVDKMWKSKILLKLGTGDFRKSPVPNFRLDKYPQIA